MKTNIAVFFGGRSVEHEISVLSALQAINAFDREKYEVVPIYITKKGKWFTGEALLDIDNYKDMKSLETKAEEVFMKPVFGDFNLYKTKTGLFSKGNPAMCELHAALPVLHGTNGEDGVFEGLLETIGLPFAGCNTLSSGVGMDKIMMKMILRSDEIPVVDFVWTTDKEWSKDPEKVIGDVESKLSYPVIVKPANLGSSVGIGKAADRDQLIKKINEAEKFSDRIIIEKCIEDLQEINCSVLGDSEECRASILEEPIKSGEILSYTDKYMGGTKTADSGMAASDKRIPADLPEEVTKRIQDMAVRTFRSLNCHGVSRVDVMIDRKTGDIYVNEINTIPGSLSYYLWEASGISFGQLIDRLVQLAYKRKREIERKTFSYDTNIFTMRGGAKGGIKGGVKNGIKR